MFFLCIPKGQTLYCTGLLKWPTKTWHQNSAGRNHWGNDFPTARGVYTRKFNSMPLKSHPDSNPERIVRIPVPWFFRVSTRCSFSGVYDFVESRLAELGFGMVTTWNSQISHDSGVIHPRWITKWYTLNKHLARYPPCLVHNTLTSNMHGVTCHYE